MIISDLNHLEAVSQTVEVTGGSLILTLPDTIVLDFLEQGNTTINGNLVETVRGGFTTPDGQTFAFSAISVSSPSPV